MPKDGSDAIGEIEDMQAGLARSLSPVDLPDPAAPLPHGLRWATMVIVYATIVLAFLNAHAVRDWAYQLPPDAASAHLVTAAEAWYGIVDQAALNRPVETMHAWWQAAREMRFHEEETPPREIRAAAVEVSPDHNLG